MKNTGCNGVGGDERDFMGADIDFDYLAGLPNIVPKMPYVDQSKGDYKMSCTMMSSYVALLSIYGGNENTIEKREILDEGIANGYIVGKGRLTQSGVKAATKVWNRNHPNHQVMYIKSEFGDGIYNTLFNKGYPCVTSLKLNSGYGKDRRDDSIVQGTGYATGIRGHAICWMKGNREDCQGKHCNTYPGFQANEYHVKDIDKLSSNGLYSDNVYFIVPAKGNIVDDTAKRMEIKVMKILCRRVKKRASSQNTKDLIDNYIKYFEDNGF